MIVPRSQIVAMIYKLVYLILTIKMPGVAEVAGFCELYYCDVPGSSGSDGLSGGSNNV